jgi:hypothetical protein
MQKHYNQWLQSCDSYKDVEDVLKNFRYDFKKMKENYKLGYSGNLKEMAYRRNSPWLTFTIMSGVCGDAAIFAEHSLDIINPNYRAKIICLQSKLNGKTRVHYVCGFYLYHKLYVMDYGTPYDSIKGTHGPFDNLEEYAKYSLKIYRQAAHKNYIEPSIKWGWRNPEYETQPWRKNLNNVPHIPAE